MHIDRTGLGRALPDGMGVGVGVVRYGIYRIAVR